MRIVVYDIAAQKGGGGETILKQYLETAARESQIEWWFFVSMNDYQKFETSNIHIVFVDITRTSKIKSYCARKTYELFKLKRVLRDIKPDKIISLQNQVVPGVNYKQTVYLHQSFQFSPVKYRFLKRDERSLAFRQKVICQLIRKRMKKADNVIVQTNWMKKAVSEWAKYPEERIAVEPPCVSLPTMKGSVETINNHFIYPANAYLNKNHQVIIDACKILKKQGVTGYRIQFTISEESNSLACHLLQDIRQENLPIDFIGHLAKDELFAKYQTMVTLFPSYIETFGLPLLEAKSVRGKIIASDLPFSHEILEDYDNVSFVDWKDAEGWASAIRDQLKC